LLVQAVQVEQALEYLAVLVEVQALLVKQLKVELAVIAVMVALQQLVLMVVAVLLEVVEEMEVRE
jgi:hypothetical protein